MSQDQSSTTEMAQDHNNRNDDDKPKRRGNPIKVAIERIFPRRREQAKQIRFDARSNTRTDKDSLRQDFR